MTFRTTTTPLDARLLSEWQTWLELVTGTTYANESATVQAEFQFLVDQAHDWVSKTYGHNPWAQQTWSVGASDLTAPSTSDGTFLLPVDCRLPEFFQESETGTGTTGIITDKKSWMIAGAGQTAHPWNDQSKSYYFRDGTDDSEPPQVVWRRVPTPSSTISAFTMIGRGYFTILTTTADDTQYTMLPAEIMPELAHHLKATLFSMRQEYDKVGIEMQMRDDAVRTTQQNSPPSGHGAPSYTDAPPDFYDELESP